MKQRYVIFFLTDQQHFRTIQENGCPEARTPHMDRLAREGYNFQNHYVVNPVCSPSRGAIWTGRYPSVNGLFGNGATLPATETTLPMVFNDNGFATGHFGKLHLEPTTTHDVTHLDFGFQTCKIGEGDQFLGHDDYGIWLRKKAPKQCQEYFYQMGLEGHMKAFVSNLPEELTLNRWITDNGINYLKEQTAEKKPFFLSLGYFDPHHAWNPCEPYASEWAFREVTPPHYDPEDLKKKPKHWGGPFLQEPFELSAIVRSYRAMTEHLDDCLGRLMEELEASGELENTVIVFSSDHGEFLGNHGKVFKGPFLCDDLLKVPMMVWDGANRNGAGKKVDALTSGMDFFSTMASLAGIEHIPENQGRRFLDADFNLCPDGERDFVISEWRQQPFGEGSGGDILSVRTKDERYLRYANTNEEEYYTHPEDPHEVNNLAADASTQSRRHELAQLLEQEGGPAIGDWPTPTAPW